MIFEVLISTAWRVCILPPKQRSARLGLELMVTKEHCQAGLRDLNEGDCRICTSELFVRCGLAACFAYTQTNVQHQPTY